MTLRAVAVAIVLLFPSVAFANFNTDALALMNAHRLAPLTESTKLDALAQQRAAYVCSHAFSHDGLAPFFTGAGYGYYGENLARGYGDDATSTIDAFMHSPRHALNIRMSFRDVGIAQQCGVTVVLFGGNY